jgi:long-subunit acyl-CoA synthetase (AMP-forming)
MDRGKRDPLGFLLMMLTVSIMDEAGREVSVTGQTGELWVKGGNVMKGLLESA